MKLSASNIAWAKEQDEKVYRMMQSLGFTGLEIAPTRWFPENPYEHVKEAAEYAKMLKKVYGFSISSMQSIWYGRQESIWGTEEERSRLIEYTKRAIDFASAIECGNLVFGCPRNRNMPDGADIGLATEFFKEIGDYAIEKGTIIGMEANPPIYNTNFINDTPSAIEFIHKVASKGFKLNLDVGTMIYNEENSGCLKGRVSLINHVHVSEPGLIPIEERDVHSELINILNDERYMGFVSIEMGKVDNTSVLKDKLTYIGRIFGR